MGKKLLSLALALGMCLCLRVPVFAAESKWKVEVSGKSNAEVLLGERTFTVRGWDYSNSGDMIRTASPPVDGGKRVRTVKGLYSGNHQRRTLRASRF